MMVLVRRMEWSLSGRSIAEGVRSLLVVLACMAAPVVCTAQSPATADREALMRLAEDAGAKGLPVAPLTNKIREGLAKRADPKRIELVIRQMTTNLESADRLVREIDPASAGPARDDSVTLLAESLGAGVTPDEVRELRKQSQAPGRPGMSAESLASAARGLSSIKDARLPVGEGSAVMAEAVRHGFRAHEIVDLGREIKRRETDYRTGRASLSALRDAIARGERPDQLFNDSRPAAGTTTPTERPAATRPEAVTERPVTRPERPQRPVERPQRPEAPTRKP
jgi:hypothetical protein